MIESGHWFLLSLTCNFFCFTNQFTLQSTFATSATFGEFWVEELGMETVESVFVAIAMIQEACDDRLDEFYIKESHPFSDIWVEETLHFSCKIQDQVKLLMRIFRFCNLKNLVKFYGPTFPVFLWCCGDGSSIRYSNCINCVSRTIFLCWILITCSSSNSIRIHPIFFILHNSCMYHNVDQAA